MDAETEAQWYRKGENQRAIVGVWVGFKRSDIDSQQLESVKRAAKQFVASKSNTSNLFDHLKTRHEKWPTDSEKVPQNQKTMKRKGETGVLSVSQIVNMLVTILLVFYVRIDLFIV